VRVDGTRDEKGGEGKSVCDSFDQNTGASLLSDLRGSIPIQKIFMMGRTYECWTCDILTAVVGYNG